MSNLALTIGILLIIVGIAGYGFSMAQGNASLTALIPSAIGLILAVLGLVASKQENLRKHLMHGALLVALLGFIFTVDGVLSLINYLIGNQVDRPLAAFSKTITAILCLIFLILGVKSFIDARRKSS
jgi:hypothetical protein